MEILDDLRVLVSGTADQKLRFWDLKEIPKKPLFTLDIDHGAGESLTAFKATSDSKFFVTADTHGQIKCWNMSKLDLRADLDEKEMRAQLRDEWFISAHRKIINSISLVESFPSDIFIISASSDCNILLHRLSNGVKIGQLGQEPLWNIHDMERYANIRPYYVREWFNERREKFKKYVEVKMSSMKDDASFKAKCALLETDMKSKPPSKRYMTQREEKEEAEKRAKELHRDKIKQLIAYDEFYEETVPFADFSSDDEEDPHADMKGKALTMYNWKSQRRQVRQRDVDKAEERHQSVKDWKNSKVLIAEAKELMARAKKTVESGQERSNKI